MTGQVPLAFGAQRLLAVLQQIADVEQLQQPTARLPQQPAAGMQGAATDRLEIQIKRLCLPVQRLAFKHQQTIRLYIILQPRLPLPR
ncbi:hypothetical protein D3C75_1239970 [compost metagenome]